MYVAGDVITGTAISGLTVSMAGFELFVSPEINHLALYWFPLSPKDVEKV